MGVRCSEIQATTLEISGGVKGWPGESLLQSGAPRSLRPEITDDLRDWSLTSVRKAGSTIDPAFEPPTPSSPWQFAQYVWKTVAPAFASPESALYGGRATPVKS